MQLLPGKNLRSTVHHRLSVPHERQIPCEGPSKRSVEGRVRLVLPRLKLSFVSPATRSPSPFPIPILLHILTLRTIFVNPRSVVATDATDTHYYERCGQPSSGLQDLPRHNYSSSHQSTLLAAVAGDQLEALIKHQNLVSSSLRSRGKTPDWKLLQRVQTGPWALKQK
jgi:hypothetical protein